MDKKQLRIALPFVTEDGKNNVYMAEGVTLHNGKVGNVVFVEYTTPEKKTGINGDYEIHGVVEYNGLESLVYQKEAKTGGTFLTTTLEKVGTNYEDNVSAFISKKIPLSEKYSSNKNSDKKYTVELNINWKPQEETISADDDTDNDLPFK